MWAMHRRIAGASAFLALALPLAGCGSSQTSSSSTATAPPQSAGAPHAGTARCRPAQLALAYAGTEGATGHMELTVAVRNTSGATCALRGYPGAQLLGGGGRALPLRVVRGHGFFADTEPAPRRVALKPGASAHVGISFVTNNEYKGARVCRIATAALLSAPGSAAHWQRLSLHAAPRIAPCGNQLVVSPVHA
jgi:Protein of unknown function (DUF4232)